MAKAKITPDFETTLAELEQIVDQLEAGDLSLEDSLAAFEQGVKLTKTCQEKLNSAEQKVQQLVEKQGEAEITPLNPAED